MATAQCVTKLEKAEQECKVLVDKKLIVENDRKSLVQVCVNKCAPCAGVLRVRVCTCVLVLNAEGLGSLYVPCLDRSFGQCGL